MCYEHQIPLAKFKNRNSRFESNDRDIDRDIDIGQNIKKAAQHDLNLNISVLFSHKYLISLHGIRGLYKLSDVDLHYCWSEGCQLYICYEHQIPLAYFKTSKQSLLIQ